MIHLYTGNGKGKSTAAIGLCIRAAGWDQQVCFAQFMKGNDTGELHVLDDLQESYHEKEQLSESYMLEALASELLLMGYGAYNRYVREKRNWRVARYHFPGSEESFPLDMVPEL